MGRLSQVLKCSSQPLLIIFGGLPGVGKTTIARELACQLSGVHVRIDSIEQAIRDSGAITGSVADLGYRVAYAIAEDNLRVGRTVIADSVNPLTLTRNAWVDVAKRALVCPIEVEIKCSDLNEHRSRVESRIIDLSGLMPPTWEEVVFRDYEQWDHGHIVIDTTNRKVEESVLEIRRALATYLINPA